MLKPEERHSTVPAFDRALAKAGPFTGSIQTMLDQAGSKMNVGSYLLTTLCVGLGAAVTMLVVAVVAATAYAGWRLRSLTLSGED